MTEIHASCVEFEGAGVLLRGPSGAGKSDLALRLIDAGARLVADDRVVLRRDGARVLAAAPAALLGQIEIRGLGIRRLAARTETSLELVVDLVPRAALERLPEAATALLEGVPVAAIKLCAFDASALAKLRLILSEPAATAMRARP